MITRPISRLALLVGVLVLCSGCGDSPLTSADLAAQSGAAPGLDASDHELLVAILNRLDSIEDRIESMVAPLPVSNAAQASRDPFAVLLAKSDSIISRGDSILVLGDSIISLGIVLGDSINSRTSQIFALFP